MPDLSQLSASPAAPFEPWREGISVSGEAFRRKDVLGFADAVAKATEAEAEFGIRLEPDPDNPASPQAIYVVGYTKPKLVPGESRFQIGFLDSAIAGEMAGAAESSFEFFAKLRAIEFANERDRAEDPINVVIDLYRAPKSRPS